jgi:hypothetical protein
MASSFVQILSSIQAPEDTSKSAAAAALDAAGGGTGSGNGAHGAHSNGKGAAGRIAPVAASAKTAEPQGTLHLMGSITKKLVLTPSHDIGVRKARTYSMSAAGAKQGIPPEVLYALGRQQAGAAGRGGLYPEDEEIVGDV